MSMRARLIFKNSTHETTLEKVPEPGEVIPVQTKQGELSLQVSEVNMLNLDCPEKLTVELRFLNPPTID